MYGPFAELIPNHPCKGIACGQRLHPETLMEEDHVARQGMPMALPGHPPGAGYATVTVGACLQANRRLVVSFGGDIFPCDTASGPRSAGGPASCGGRLQHGGRRALSPIRLDPVLGRAVHGPGLPAWRKRNGRWSCGPVCRTERRGRAREKRRCLSERSAASRVPRRPRPASERGHPGPRQRTGMRQSG